MGGVEALIDEDDAIGPIGYFPGRGAEVSDDVGMGAADPLGFQARFTGYIPGGGTGCGS